MFKMQNVHADDIYADLDIVNATITLYKLPQ